MDEDRKGTPTWPENVAENHDSKHVSGIQAQEWGDPVLVFHCKPTVSNIWYHRSAASQKRIKQSKNRVRFLTSTSFWHKTPNHFFLKVMFVSLKKELRVILSKTRLTWVYLLRFHVEVSFQKTSRTLKALSTKSPISNTASTHCLTK